MVLQDPIQNLPKITKPQIAALKKLGITNVRELLFHLPYRYLDFSKLSKIKNLTAGENITIEGTIKNIESRFSFRSRMSLAEAVISDDTGSIKVVWFNQGYLAKTLSKGEKIFLAGSPEYYKNSLQMTNPIHEKVSDFPVHTARLVPVYHLTQNLYPKTLRNLIAAALPAAQELEDILPSSILKNQDLPDIQKTIKISHFPKSEQDAKLARKRLAFEEIFINQLAAQKYKLELEQKKAFTVKFDQGLVKNFVSSLPFQLTDDQRKAAWQVLQDLEKPMPMNRLLEGDVGSGKTLVALIAALLCIKQDLQVAFMAPTEILAKQHFETAKKYLRQEKVSLLTNSYSIVGRKHEVKVSWPKVFKIPP